MKFYDAKLVGLPGFIQEYLQHWAVCENRAMTQLSHTESPICVHGCETNPGHWLQRARNIQNRIWLLVNTLSACQTHVCCSLRWVSSFCSFPTKVNSVCMSAKCQHVFVKPTSCSDNLNFPYELLLDECDIPSRVAGNEENRWPLILLVTSWCALMVLMIIIAADTDVSRSRTRSQEWLRMKLQAHPDAKSRPQWCEA